MGEPDKKSQTNHQPNQRGNSHAENRKSKPMPNRYTQYNPHTSPFLCYCGGRTPIRVDAVGRHEARALAAKYFKVGMDKIRAVVPVERRK